MDNKEYYDFICTMTSGLNLTETDAESLEIIIRKIEYKIRERANIGETTLYVEYSLLELLSDGIKKGIYVNKKWRKLLEKTLYKNLKDGGFYIERRRRKNEC